jgi:hypothetical protein
MKINLRISENELTKTKKTKTKHHCLSSRANYIPTERPPLVGEVSANF